MHRIGCSEVWGGVRGDDVDVCTAGLTATLFSRAADGGKGGDVYYFSVCGQDQLTRIAVADVVGHGSAASGVGEWLLAALQAQMNDCDGTRVLVELNRRALDHGARALATAAVVAFYVADSNLYYSYAGHPPVLVWRAARRTWETARVADQPGLANLPLGVTPEARYAQGSSALSSGDRLLVYTDGLIEARAPDGELFGTQRLQAVLERAGSGSLHDVKTAVIEAVRDFAAGTLTHDDVTLMAIEVN